VVPGIKAHWIRGRLDQPLPPDPARGLPLLDRLRVRTEARKEVWSQSIRELKPGAPLSVEGAVRDHSGMPLAGVRLTLTDPDVTIRALTDAQGGYRIDGVVADTNWAVRLDRIDLPPFAGQVRTGGNSLEMSFTLGPGVAPELAYGAGQRLDLSSSFYPFG